MDQYALVSVVRNDVVITKIFARCNPRNGFNLATKIQNSPNVLELREVYELALKEGFGCPECLAVLDSQSGLFDISRYIGYESHPGYRQTFSDPRFDPRAYGGRNDFTVVTRI